MRMRFLIKNTPMDPELSPYGKILISYRVQHVTLHQKINMYHSCR